MKKNIKIKTNSFRLSITLKANLKLLNDKEFSKNNALNTEGHAKVNGLKERTAFTLACPSG
ncbi:hypothetical protein [Vibrio navarrensis]|uniref:hypothetical protein n=1 Tax=Vibrio navarrensis TaxID=29495 RepID=UPI00051CF6FC|nr:hypothetical protein [Vibrio navarrensis]KGK08513.1 hypothetical protein EA24_02670 [Vibrio navarrensis]